MRNPEANKADAPTPALASLFQIERHWCGVGDRVASAIVCDGVSTAAVVFAPEYGNEDDHQIRSHICSRDCAGSTGPDRLAPEA